MLSKYFTAYDFIYDFTREYLVMCSVPDPNHEPRVNLWITVHGMDAGNYISYHARSMLLIPANNFILRPVREEDEMQFLIEHAYINKERNARLGLIRIEYTGDIPAEFWLVRHTMSMLDIYQIFKDAGIQMRNI